MITSWIVVDYHTFKSCFNSIFHLLEVVARYCNPQLQVGEKCSYETEYLQFPLIDHQFTSQKLVIDMIKKGIEND